MAFEIKLSPSCKVDWNTILSRLENSLFESRFSARINLVRKKITIHEIRLKVSKDYCGNHPYACPTTPFKTKHKKYTYLEGADWVAFNDMVNHVLNDLGVSANVATSLVVIRKGREQCTEYKGYSRNGIVFEWVKDSGCFADRIGKKHKTSKYPAGTPGIAQYF